MEECPLPRTGHMDEKQSVSTEEIFKHGLLCKKALRGGLLLGAKWSGYKIIYTYRDYL